MSAKRTCRLCGCTDEKACATPRGPCEWVEADLCSGCVVKSLLADPDFHRLMRHPIVIETDGQTVMNLISAIQLVCRHPNFRGDVRQSVETLARDLQELLSVKPALAWMLAAGWNERHDVIELEPPKIIVPPGVKL